MCLTIFFASMAHKAQAEVDFIMNVLITGSFIWIYMIPYFDPSYKTFVLMCSFCSFLGGIIGGVISILLPKITTGISLGLLLSIVFGLFCLVSSDSLESLFAIGSVIIITISIIIAQRLEEFSSHIRTSLTTGLLFTLSIDVLINDNKGLLYNIENVIRFQFEPCCFTSCYIPFLLIVWIVFTVFTFFILAQFSGVLKKINWSNSIRGNYKPINNNNDLENIKNVDIKQKTFSYPDALEFNYFDVDNLPELLQPYSDIVFNTVQSLAKVYGFQVDNSRNQAEHVLMMLVNEINASDGNSLSGSPQRLHAKIFSNYKKWCKRMIVKPLFCKLSSAYSSALSNKVYSMYIEDILMFFLIWGEAANLKHMPECLCFLFHKTMLEHIENQSNIKNIQNDSYPGFFLDMCITPIYEVVSKSLNNNSDHNHRKTYDDFNEFFWSTSCLRYRIYNLPKDDAFETGEHWKKNNDPLAENIHVAQAMDISAKTYVEKRSWLHPLLTLHRVFEWHAITFSILIAIAFSEELIWSYPFLFQVGSFIFWEISFFRIIWTCLEVWALYPNSVVSIPSMCGFLIRLLAGFLVLVYQTIYYHWSFRQDIDIDIDSLRSQGSPSFWWWQYIWLSLLASSLYFCQSCLCYFPSISSKIMTCDNYIIQSILNICYPISQLYVAKEVHVDQASVTTYIFYWYTLIFFKLWFGYYYIVRPVCSPSILLYDDYMNYNNVTFLHTALLMCVWWLPHFLVYIIDMTIWYSVWSSISGGFIALIDRQGAIRDSSSFRSHFMRLPLAFCQKLMPFTSKVGSINTRLSTSVSTANLRNIKLKSKQNIISPNEVSKKRDRAMSSTDLDNTYQRELPKDQEGQDNIDLANIGNILDIRSQRWVIFGRVWNEIILHLRLCDYISNTEKEWLLFSTFDFLSKPVYLPLYQTSGIVCRVVEIFKDASIEYSQAVEPQNKLLVWDQFVDKIDVTESEAVAEALEEFNWILSRLLGPIHSEDVTIVFNTISIWGSSHDIFNKMDMSNLTKIFTLTGNIIATLKSCMKSRKKNPVVTSSVVNQALNLQKNNTDNNPDSKSPRQSNQIIKKSVSTGFLQALGENENSNIHTDTNFIGIKVNSSSNSSTRYTKLQPFRKAIILNDNVRDKVRDDMRSLFAHIRNALRVTKGINIAGTESLDLIHRITFILSMESGFLWHDIYASKQIDELANDQRSYNLLSKLEGLLKLRQTEVELLSPEANRRLNFFTNSLFMELPNVPISRFCKEYTCITPFYSEDVLLSKNDLESKNSDGVSTILYLQTLYKRDWNNYLERMGCEEHQVWSNSWLQSTRMWASIRAQTLFRTVEGMMYSEAAIRLLAELEDISKPEIDLFAKLKFNYVVACQVYGQQRKDHDPKADDIDFLLSRHPNLRVAYIDCMRVNREGDLAYYSVLIKHDSVLSAAKEVYRVKLPGNPVIGEGKPENQNHALIFSRGRFLQAIDMNQDGYFEEALKMRNLLQEFDTGIKILGFREHIFTGSVSSVANYMALQELSFVTLGQRVLRNPLRIRQHYGHPDMFDKLFVMTEGGMSKASRGINLSEDVFAGFNATIRGHSIGFKEYAQVGKGRDVGLQQTYKFEAKLAQGNAEQSLSRDLYRICNRLDFFRLLSFYYGGIGHYLSQTMVMFTLVIVVYTMLNLAIYDNEGINGRKMDVQGMTQLLLSGLGILQTLPLAVTLTVEKGFFNMLQEILYMIFSGGPLYFIFHIQTKCYYFQQTLLAGGAVYRPTGRGFVIRHSPFDENYRFFATSHIYLGFELMSALILLRIYTKSTQYYGVSWSLWLVVISLLIGPFWFNPITFEWNKLKEDYLQYMRWMTEIGPTAEQSWETWFREECLYFEKLSLSWKLFLFIQRCGVWIFVAYGLIGMKIFHDISEQQRLIKVIFLFFIFYFGSWLIFKLEKSMSYAVRRVSSISLTTSIASIIIYLFFNHTLYIRYTVAFYYFLSALSYTSLLCNVKAASHAYKFHDYLVGHTIFLMISILSFLQIGYLQTWLLYHNALSAGVVIDDILKHARKTKEQASDDSDLIHELKKHVLEQDRLIKSMLQLQNNQPKKFTNGDIQTEKSNLIGINNLDIKYGATNDVYNEFNKPVNMSLSPKSSLSSKIGSPKFSTITTITSPNFAASISPRTNINTNINSSVIKNILIPEKNKSEAIVTSISAISPKQKSEFNSPRLKSTNEQTNTGTLSLIPPNPKLSFSSTSLQDMNANNSKIVSQVNDITPTTDFIFIQPTKFPIRDSNNSTLKSPNIYD